MKNHPIRIKVMVIKYITNLIVKTLSNRLNLNDLSKIKNKTGKLITNIRV
ncbi:hypothetical protein AT1219_50136 [Vibrio alginolyticus]